ncbi:hypothetical protein HMPREF3192_00824 [Atopobium deltae]|uniref:Uncharacterized protein n=1 Tax=Atopobium deltae TaxID=1393034 RepID=A0A133XUI5_9ACTN|nr:hypothetical protein HMPREF3192_00824 [Atopobium deltae]
MNLDQICTNQNFGLAPRLGGVYIKTSHALKRMQRTLKTEYCDRKISKDSTANFRSKKHIR